MISKAQIDAFQDTGLLAIAGVSRDKKKFGRLIFESLLKKDWQLFPVNPHVDPFLDKDWYPDVMCLPENVDHLLIVTPPQATYYVVQTAIEKGIRNLWIQQRSETPEALNLAKESGLNVIHGLCFLMFAKPVVGLHKVHQTIHSLLGKLPK